MFRPRFGVALVVLIVGAFASRAAADVWRAVPNASRFVRAGAAHVTLEAHASGGGGCGGGGCNQGIEIRNVHGALPAQSLSYYYSDRPGANPGCYGTAFATLLDTWRAIEIAPAAGTEADRPSCGIGLMAGSAMQYWVIVRVRTR